MGEIGVGIIGTGFMGACHALAFTAVGPVFQPTLRPRLEMVADIDEVAAQRARARFGFARATGDWRALVADPAVELVSITAPNVWHKGMALAAIGAGKHVYCEKPLSLTIAESRAMVDAARTNKIVFQTEGQFSTSRSNDGLVSEFLYLTIPYSKFQKLVASKEFSLKMGEKKYDLTDEQLQAVRSMTTYVK